MEGSKEQDICNVNSSGSKLRYPLRSAFRSNEVGLAVASGTSGSSATRRGRPLPDVSKSVSVLQLSGKDNAGQPPRRLSVPSKSAASPRPAPIGSVTPTSETRTWRSNIIQGRSDTPRSDVSKSSSRRKFCVLSSVSYWLSQIKLSESASKHSVSLGFFRLALEAGCEPMQRVQEELKLYVLRHNLITELEESAKEVLQRYNILEDFEKLNISGATYGLWEEGIQVSHKDVHNSAAGTGSLKPKSLNGDALADTNSNNAETVQKRTLMPRNKAPHNKNSTKTVSHLKAQKRTELVCNTVKGKSNSSMKKTPVERVASVDPLPAEEAPNEEEKENMEVRAMEGTSLDEEIQTS